MAGEADPQLGCVEIKVDGLPGGRSCLLEPGPALDLALRKLEVGEDLGPPDLGPGSLGSRF